MLNHYQSLYSKSLSAQNSFLHFAAHSHHLWPDAAFLGHKLYEEHVLTHTDHKWGPIFSLMKDNETRLQHFLGSTQLNIVFGQNTHELFFKLLSCFSFNKKIKVITSDQEFLSFERQIKRLELEQLAEVTRVPVEPFNTFEERFIQIFESQSWDLGFLSQVFYLSGQSLDTTFFQKLSLKKTKHFIIDAYHGFFAKAFSMKQLEHFYYLAGGYKYAGMGEGCCFLHIPHQETLKPLYTGWLAEMQNLTLDQNQSFFFPHNPTSFLGATFEPMGLYRMNAVLKMYQEHHISFDTIAKHAKLLQNYFYEKAQRLQWFAPHISPVSPQLGNFLTVKMKSTSEASQLVEHLYSKKIVCDARGLYVRIGFGLYQDFNQIDEFFKRVL